MENSVTHSVQGDFQYHFLKDPNQRYEILNNGFRFIQYVKTREYDTLVFQDRGARTIAWLTDALWEKVFPDQTKPDFLFFNSGQKSLRGQYMYGVGSAVTFDELGGYSFVGIYDTKENIELFKKRVKSDEKSKQQIKDELGKEGTEKLTGKRVLIIDWAEFEGVSRLFSEEILDEIYSPQSIDYWEYGNDLIELPTGLSEEEYDPSFIAKPSKNLESIMAAEAAQHEIFQLVEEFY